MSRRQPFRLPAFSQIRQTQGSRLSRACFCFFGKGFVGKARIS